MKSAVFYGPHDLRVEERGMPPLGAHDVMIRVNACGICGTDVHIYEGDKGAAKVNPPTVPGHEFAGVIAQTGSAVTAWKKGERVCADPNRYCGSCTPCRSGAVHFCRNMTGYGTTADGGFAEYCAVDERQLYRLGANTSFEQGAMAEPLSCCLHGIDMCGIRPGSQVVIIGGGMIGLLMLQLSKLAGAAKTALLEPVEAKRDMAGKLGADICINPMAEDTACALKNAGFSNIDTVIECAGRPVTIGQAIDIAGYQAVVMMFGLTRPDETVAVKPFQIFQKELVLKSSYINPLTFQRALDLIDSGKIDVTGMIYETCSLDRLDLILSSPGLRAKGKYIVRP